MTWQFVVGYLAGLFTGCVLLGIFRRGTERPTPQQRSEP